MPVMVFIRPAPPPFFLGELGDDPASLPDPAASNLSKESFILSFGGVIGCFEGLCAFDATSLRLGVLLGVETLDDAACSFAALL